MSFQHRYAVTGAEDNKLRLWPLDFTDFLLEAQHEGCVTQIHVAVDGRKLCIGTDAGTLGVLNVSEHSYSTVLRSHCGSVTQAVPCLTGAKKGMHKWLLGMSFLKYLVVLLCAIKPPSQSKMPILSVFSMLYLIVYFPHLPFSGLEFATVGKDNTVRIWDAVSGNQVGSVSLFECIFTYIKQFQFQVYSTW